MRWVFEHWYVTNRPEQSIVCTSKYRWSTKLLGSLAASFCSALKENFGKSWRAFSASLAVEIFLMWVSKGLKTASAGGTHLKLCPMQIRCNGQKRTDWKYVIIQKTSRLAGGFNFVRIELKLSVKVGTIFLCLRRYHFSFLKMGFLEAKKMSSASTTPRGGTPSFKWRGWSNGGKNQYPKKSLGASNKTQKNLWTKNLPQKNPMPKFRALISRKD